MKAFRLFAMLLALCLALGAVPALAEELCFDAEPVPAELEGELLTDDMQAAPQPESAVMAAEDDAEAEGLPVTEKTFPDEAFRKYILEYIDTDQDGALSDAEIGAVTRIDLPADVIDATGISSFVKVKGIGGEWGGKLKKLPLGKLPRLEWLNVCGTRLEELELGGCPALLDLNVSENKLTTLDVSKNTKLKELAASYNKLTAINVSKNTKLTSLTVRCNSGLKKLDVSKNTKLNILLCGYTAVGKVDIANCPKLLAVMKKDYLPHVLTKEKKYTGGSIAWSGDPWEDSEKIELPTKARLYNGKKLLYKNSKPTKLEFYVTEYSTGKTVNTRNNRMTATGEYYLRVKATPAYAAKPLVIELSNNKGDYIGIYNDNNGFFQSQEPGTPTLKVYMSGKKVYSLKIKVDVPVEKEEIE